MSYKYFLRLQEMEHYRRLEEMDLGEQIRKQLKNLTNPALLTNEDNEKLTKQIDSLERLTLNVHFKKHPRKFTSTATGLTASQCSQVLSSEFLQYLNDNDKKGKKKED